MINQRQYTEIFQTAKQTEKKMATEVEASSSGNESFDDAGNFDLVDVPIDQQIHLELQYLGIQQVNLTRTPISRAFEPEDANAAPEFGTWRWEKNENNRNISPFTERPGPTRVINGAANSLDYFQLFYSDELFQNIVDLQI